MLRFPSSSGRLLLQSPSSKKLLSFYHGNKNATICVANRNACTLRTVAHRCNLRNHHHVPVITTHIPQQQVLSLSPSSKYARCLSSETKKQDKKDNNSEETSQELVLTPGEKVVAGTRLTLWAGVAVFAGFCAFYIGKELFPTKMSPNSVFDGAFAKIRDHSEVNRRFGAPLKAYGRDHGGHREGRRNFVEHTDYTDQEDGTKRTRVRFNLEGKYSSAFVFAEVSADMPSGEFVYILVQDKRNGQVITVLDNRSALMAKRMAGGNQEGIAALQNLLGGGSKSS